MWLTCCACLTLKRKPIPPPPERRVTFNLDGPERPTDWVPPFGIASIVETDTDTDDSLDTLDLDTESD